MPHGRMSLDEVKKVLISGKKLEWQEHLKFSAGDITLDTAAKRRLFQYLSSCKSDELEDPTEEIFQGLIKVWDADDDPAIHIDNVDASSVSVDTWRLDRISTYGFGGLNQFLGPIFNVDLNAESWCIEGQNGSGKTSLASAIIWALTGQVIREHSGVMRNGGERRDVYSNNGTVIGTWPPIAAYPVDENDLSKTAKVFVKLVFKNSNGKKAVVYRRIRCDSGGNIHHLFKKDPSINSYESLIETSVVMPNRLGHLGFGDRSENLSDAVKMLTGLDFLESIGKGIAKIKRGGSRFLNYSKQNRMNEVYGEYIKWLNLAKGYADTTGYDLTDFENIDQEKISDNLETVRLSAENEAKIKMENLIDVLASNIDLEVQADRDKVKQAVERIKIRITSKPTELSNTFKSLAELTNSYSSGEFQEIEGLIKDANSSLETALQWYARQKDDIKLIFKAEASVWFEITLPHNCPLCESELVSEKQKKLASELLELKKNADEAKKSIEDVSNGILKKLSNAIPRSIQPKTPYLLSVDIKNNLLNEINDSFINSNSFTVLEGAKKLLEMELDNKWNSLPSFPLHHTNPENSQEPQVVQEVRIKISEIAYLLELAEWWADNKSKYWEFWKSTIGQPMPSDSGFIFPESVLGKHVQELDRSLSGAKPYDETANAIKNAIEKERKWSEINTHQKMREEIAEAISPLSLLVNYVNTETSRSIDSLSSRIGVVLRKIHLHERLGYKDTAFVRETARKSIVNVHGYLNGEFKIDATLVANTSWLRAILWAFIFSLREEILETLGFNPFPLMVMDDPQTTFDPRNEHLWANEIVRLSNSSTLDIAQIFLTTHETSFFKTLVDVNREYTGRYGRIASISDELGVPHIDDDTYLERIWKKAKKNNDDVMAREFISSLRIFLESTLRYILFGEGAIVRNELLSQLIQRLKRLSDSGAYPFSRPTIKDLANSLVSQKARISKIQESHHRHTQGFPDAKDIYSNLWESLSKKLHEAFNIVADFRVYQGDHRHYSYNDNVIALPVKQKEEIKQLRMTNTGIAAAASTDGRAGDGLVMLNELDVCPEIFLKNHDVFRLVAQTLEPVANIGDYLIIRNDPRLENRCLVVAGYNNRFLARRYSEPEDHPYTSVLTAETIDPSGTADPILTASKNVNAKMIVGTLFNNSKAMPNSSNNNEVAIVEDPSEYRDLIDNSHLFLVQGQSAEPIALDGQYLITGKKITTQVEMRKLNGSLVIASDNEGTRYFKRFRLVGTAKVILESLNPNGLNPSILASLDDSTSTQLISLLPVNGVLFELP